MKNYLNAFDEYLHTKGYLGPGTRRELRQHGWRWNKKLNRWLWSPKLKTVLNEK